MTNQITNQAAFLYWQLYVNCHQDSASHQVEVDLANLAAFMADKEDPVLVGQVNAEVSHKHVGLVDLLNEYGILLRQRFCEWGIDMFIFLERCDNPPPIEFEGATFKAVKKWSAKEAQYVSFAFGNSELAETDSYGCPV